MAGLVAASCSPQKKPMNPPPAKDIHSYSNPQAVRVTHLDLDLDVRFEEKILAGAVTLDVERLAEGPLILDTRGLAIEHAEADHGTGFHKAAFELGPADPILGAPLTIHVPKEVKQVRVAYRTTPGATALQWLEPAQTASRKQFLFTQSQAIHARSWIPLQDTPGVRQTYKARIRVPKDRIALMSARHRADAGEGYHFSLPVAIPSYLIALAVGELEFRSLGSETGVWAERPLIDAAAREFEDTQHMLEATEALYGPYQWNRYDVLVLPPSFPFGGMENPLLTFATPTIIAGDKSLVSLVAHELAHSWSGNLVTNATWSDFWLNEGFTVYVERRILEAVYGRERADMEAVLGKSSLLREMAKLKPEDQVLHQDLKGRDPDDAATDVPYEKGALLLLTIEYQVGREPFDRFLRSYFEHFQFRSITTADFVAYLREHLGPLPSIPLDEWLYQPGIPASAYEPKSAMLSRIESEARSWKDGRPAGQLAMAGWSTHEWLHFLQSLPRTMDPARMAELDQAFQFTGSRNGEIACEWLEMAIRNGYRAADRRVEEFLTSQGRRKYLKPLYEELAKTPEGKRRAREIYAKARAMYHPIAAATVDAILR